MTINFSTVIDDKVSYKILISWGVYFLIQAFKKIKHNFSIRMQIKYLTKFLSATDTNKNKNPAVWKKCSARGNKQETWESGQPSKS